MNVRVMWGKGEENSNSMNDFSTQKRIVDEIA